MQKERQGRWGNTEVNWNRKSQIPFKDLGIVIEMFSYSC